MTWFIAFNAVLRKEVLVYLRRKQLLVATVFAAVALSLAILANWPSQYANWQYANMLSNQLLAVLQIVLLFSALALTPAIAAGMISGEQERNTWDLCVASPMPPSALIAGKWAASSGLVAALMIAMAPFLATVFFLIGVDTVQVVYCSAITLSAALVASLGGIAASVSTRSSIAATILAYFFILFLLGAWPAVYAVGEELDLVGWVSPQLFVYFFGSSPLILLIAVLQGGAQNATFVVYTIYMGGIAALLWGYILYRLHNLHDPEPLPESDAYIPFWKLVVRRRQKAIPPQPPMPDRRNPVLRRERTWGMALGPEAERATFMRILLASMGFSGVVISGLGSYYLERPDLIASIAGFLGLGMVLVIPALIAGIFPREYERRTATSLSLTLQTRQQIALGKTIAGARRTLAVIVPVLLNVSAVYLLFSRTPAATVAYNHAMLCLPAIAWVTFVLSTVASMQSPTSANAIVRSLIYIAIAGAAGPLFLTGIADVTWRGSNILTGQQLNALASLLSPAFAFVWSLNEVNGRVQPLTVFCAVLHTSLAALWLAVAIHRFRYRFDQTVDSSGV